MLVKRNDRSSVVFCLFFTLTAPECKNITYDLGISPTLEAMTDVPSAKAAKRAYRLNLFVTRRENDSRKPKIGSSWDKSSYRRRVNGGKPGLQTKTIRNWK